MTTTSPLSLWSLFERVSASYTSEAVRAKAALATILIVKNNPPTSLGWRYWTSAVQSTTTCDERQAKRVVKKKVSLSLERCWRRAKRVAVGRCFAAPRRDVRSASSLRSSHHPSEASCHGICNASLLFSSREHSVYSHLHDDAEEQGSKDRNDSINGRPVQEVPSRALLDEVDKHLPPKHRGEKPGSAHFVEEYGREASAGEVEDRHEDHDKQNAYLGLYAARHVPVETRMLLFMVLV